MPTQSFGLKGLKPSVFRALVSTDTCGSARQITDEKVSVMCMKQVSAPSPSYVSLGLRISLSCSAIVKGPSDLLGPFTMAERVGFEPTVSFPTR